MQVSNTFNNVIRILFNPKIEAFKLFDFLAVKSEHDKYIAQIIEIYDDKFDASQNVAKLKLFYKINKNNEVMPYDNFTPNKECEILKIKQEEIEDFLNNGKETFEFGNNAKTNKPLNIQYDFFNNNAVIVADKVENAGILSVALAKKLSPKKHSIIIDATGIIEFEEAKRIKASKDFKMPLNYVTIDYIFDKCLNDATLEFQAVCGEILNEIKKFARKQQFGFIPFNSFLRVLLEQYKATPYTELKLLISRLKKFQMNEIFARNKKDYENLFNTVSKNKITLIDLSGIDVFWQKAYLEYIVDGLEDEVYLITRINDENCDIDLINKIYCKKRNISFVPNVSYNYKKLPSVIQYCKNYILMQSLYQRTDFLNANFAISNLITEDCILFGENTGDFLYLSNDFELKLTEKKIEYRKIALSLLDEDDAPSKVDIPDKSNQKTESEKLIEELDDFRDKQKEEFGELAEEATGKSETENPELESKEDSEQKVEDYFEDAVKAENEQGSSIGTKDNFEELSDNSYESSSMVLSSDKAEEDSLDIEIEDNSIESENIELDDATEASDNKGEQASSASKTNELELSDDELDFFQMAKETEDVHSTESIEIEEESVQPKEETIELQEEPEEETIELQEEPEEPTVSVNENKNEENSNDSKEIIEMVEPVIEEPEIKQEDIEIIDDSTSKEKEDIQISEENSESFLDDEVVDLGEIANNSIDDSFEDIINSKSEQSEESISITEDTQISSDITEIHQDNEDLPIFKEELPKSDEETTFKEGDVIRHKKYGKGTIVKIIQYEQRQFVQVDFGETGKYLLDPKVADIKLEQ